MSSLELVYDIVKILDSKKASDIKAIHIGENTTIGDYFVIASANNTTLVKALVEEMDKQLKEKNIKHKRIEGYQTANWILVDYYDVIVHIFYEEARAYYDLEKLWKDCPQVELSDIIQE